MNEAKRPPVVLASASPARGQVLRQAGVVFESEPARVDEDEIKAAMLADGARPRDIAQALAELKALRVSGRRAGLVIGADQVLDFEGELLSKPTSVGVAEAQLRTLRGAQHRLISAVAVARENVVLWRHVADARLTMRQFSDTFLASYLSRNGERVTQSVGGYQIEGEGLQLFSAIAGDYFTILGLPLLPLLDFLRLHNAIET